MWQKVPWLSVVILVENGWQWWTNPWSHQIYLRSPDGNQQIAYRKRGGVVELQEQEVIQGKEE